MQDLLGFLREEGIDSSLTEGIEDFRSRYPAEAGDLERIPDIKYLYYGKEIWEQAIAALLCGKNLLLAGQKATGKNILAMNLAAAFGRPEWDVSFHIHTDAAALIGTDTFEAGNVIFRPGPVSCCAEHGGFGVLDEINMAKNEALAVLHAALDFRRIIEVPGYERIRMDGAARFIATMNHGYAGTRELNEALLSRFVVIQMPVISFENLIRLLKREAPALRQKAAEQLAGLFFDIQKKCDSSEISTKALDLRGLLDAVQLMERGLEPVCALELCLVNKSFDEYERTLVKDMVRGRIPKRFAREKVFSE